MIAQGNFPPARGAPILGLGALLAAWVIARVVFWSSPFLSLPASEPINELAAAGSEGAANHVAVTPQADWAELVRSTSMPVQRQQPLLVHQAKLLHMSSGETRVGNTATRFETAAWHQKLRLAALRIEGEPLQAGLSKSVSSSGGSAQSLRPISGERLWFGNSWVFLRQGSGAQGVLDSISPRFGASQFGGNIRYRLRTEPAGQQHVYLRTYRALVDPSESQLAVGFSAKPLQSLPVRANVESQFADQPHSSEVRMAGFAHTEFPPITMPGRFKAEVYAQAGYVTGRNATGFVQGQAVVSRDIAEFRLENLHLGAGAWGGAQQGAHRLDFGPSVYLTTLLGEAPVRISVDWRQRVVGDALPASGLAATISTDF